jgi:hypothetical protein
MEGKQCRRDSARRFTHCGNREEDFANKEIILMKLTTVLRLMIIMLFDYLKEVEQILDNGCAVCLPPAIYYTSKSVGFIGYTSPK